MPPKDDLGRTLQGVMVSALLPERVPRLTVLRGPGAGRKLRVTDGVVIGRDDDAEIFIEESGISRRHAVVRVSGSVVSIEDLQSRNGTFVNGTRIRSCVLTSGDHVQLGTSVVLGFSIESPDEERVLQAQKMEAIGQLAAGVNHDLNNLLSVLVATVASLRQLAENTPIGHPDVQECIEDIDAATARATELTARLAGFARGGTGGHAQVDLAALCEEVVQLLRRTFPRSITIVMEIEPDLFVRGDQAQLYQLLANPCINARDAMPEGGKLTLNASHLRSSSEDASARQTDHVLVTIQDTGVGMDADTLANVFEPFFTTKAAGGTGLGMSITRQIALAHGGEVHVSSALGKGTTVSVRLPAIEGGGRRGPRKHEASTQGLSDPKSGATGLILVVDDEDAVRRAIGRILKRAGYEVCEAPNGQAALELVARPDSRPDLVVLDLEMPVMGGVECFERLLDIEPELPVVFVSGHWDQAKRHELTERGAEGFIRKPIDVPLLKETVRHALARKSSPST